MFIVSDDGKKVSATGIDVAMIIKIATVKSEAWPKSVTSLQAMSHRDSGFEAQIMRALMMSRLAGLLFGSDVNPRHRAARTFVFPMIFIVEILLLFGVSSISAVSITASDLPQCAVECYCATAEKLNIAVTDCEGQCRSAPFQISLRECAEKACSKAEY